MAAGLDFIYFTVLADEARHFASGGGDATPQAFNADFFDFMI